MADNVKSPGTPADWLARAKSNLALAKTPKPDDVYWEDLCFNLQQAAEKAMKAVLLHQDVNYPSLTKSAVSLNW